MTGARLTIGEFSRLCRLTVVALRHYDKVGVLRPAEVDETTGYRYYRAEQVEVALRIGLLRSFDVSIADLRRLATGSATLGDVLATQRALLTAEIDDRKRMIGLLDAVANGDERQQYEIARAVEPACGVVALTFETSSSRVERATRHALARLVVTGRRAGLQPDGSTGALFPVEPSEQMAVTVFAAVAQVDRPALDRAGMSYVELPAVDAITAMHRGDHRLLAYAYHAVLGQMMARGLAATGPAREYYTTAPPRDVACTRLVIPVGQNAS